MKTRTRNALIGTRYTVENSPAMCALIDFAAQNAGLDFANYGNHAAYGQEARSISQDWRRVKAALAEASAEGVTDDGLIAEAPRAFSGRLTWVKYCTTNGAHEPCASCGVKRGDPHTDKCEGGLHDVLLAHWSYCTGQYFPTEYRKAAASVIESAISRVRQARPPAKRMPRTISELRALAKENGSHWFDASSMRFFGTKIESDVVRGNYFVTSEQPPHGPRKFTLRSFDNEARIGTIGEFCSFPTKRDAIAAIPEESA